MLLHNKHKIFCKDLLHTWSTRKSCFKSVFYGQKTKKCCKNTAAKSDEFDFVAVFLQYIFAAKIEIASVMGGPRAASYIYAQRSTFLLRVDEKCSSWLLS